MYRLIGLLSCHAVNVSILHRIYFLPQMTTDLRQSHCSMQWNVVRAVVYPQIFAPRVCGKCPWRLVQYAEKTMYLMKLSIARNLQLCI